MAAGILSLFSPKARRLSGAAKAWHDEIQTLARKPDLYQRGYVPDTVDGRFHMLALMSALVLRRLRDAGADGRALADKVYREVFSGIDHAMREEGVGDSSIARKMRKRGESFFGLARAVDGAFGEDNTDIALRDVLERNAIASGEASEAISGYLIEVSFKLSDLPLETLISEGPWPLLHDSLSELP